MYNHKALEPKWQKYWQENKTFAADDTSKKPKYYILDMFPYPSGAGLHVGHPEGYTATDIISQYKRLKGYNVLHPMGWDAFGLPAENYAIKTKIHPKQTTDASIETFRRQIQSIGFDYDWSREVNTSAAEYYQFTQWFFLFLYKNNLAYKKKAPVNWCESCKTVLANEQVVQDACERCHNPVIQKDLEQWFFKITDFIEDTEYKGRATTGLLNGLKKIDWPHGTLTAQENWIGKKEGIIIHHQVKDLDLKLDTFSAYPAWLFADTFMVIAPDHPVCEELVKGTEYEKPVQKFIKECRKLTAQDRNEDKYEKKGIFTGRYAIDPLTGNEMPIWLANFALLNFGTGIIRCSAHDTRDYEFATKYDIPLKEVVSRTDSDQPINAHDNQGVLTNSGPFTGKNISAKLIEEMMDWFIQKGYGKRHTTYKLRDWLLSRQRYWGSPIPIVYDPEGNPHPVKEEHLPLLLPTDVDFNPKGTSPLASSKEYKKRAEELYGKGWYFEVDTMDTFVCSSWYFFRYTDPKNTKVFAEKKKMDYWLPVDTYVGGAEHTVLHLLYSRFFTKALHRYGYIDFDEPFLKLRHQGLILGEDNEKMSKSRGNVINPDDVISEFGADTLRLYEMFMGEFAQSKPWNTKGIQGVYRFLKRVERFFADQKSAAAETPEDITKLLHKSIKKVSEDIENFGFNTALSQLMILLNAFYKAESVSREIQKTFLILLAPFAPHLAEELFEKLGYKPSIFSEQWPQYDAELVQDDTVEFVIQVNGKIRDKAMVSADFSKEEALAFVQQSEKLKPYLTEKVVKEIFVPGKLLNLVIPQNKS